MSYSSKFTVDCILAKENGNEDNQHQQGMLNGSAEWDWLMKPENEQQDKLIQCGGMQHPMKCAVSIKAAEKIECNIPSIKQMNWLHHLGNYSSEELNQKRFDNFVGNDPQKEGQQCQKNNEKLWSSFPPSDALLVSQWAAQFFRQFLVANNCSEMCEGSSNAQIMMPMKIGNQSSSSSSLALNPPLALNAGTGFPLFQQMQKSKRIRTAFSPGQLVQLEQAFQRSQYLVGSERKQLAKQLALSETQVKVWFQNRRTKSKRFIDDDGLANSMEILGNKFVSFEGLQNENGEEEEEEGFY